MNRDSRIGKRDFASCLNMASDRYPFAAPRRGRVKLRENMGKVYGALCLERMATVRGGEVGAVLYWGEVQTPLQLEAGEKQMVAMGTKIIIFPDCAFYDTYDGSYGSLEAYFTSAENVNVSMKLCRADGTEYVYSSSATAPESLADGVLWCDTSSGTPVLKQFSANDEMWNEIPSTYVKISTPGIGEAFKQYDGVTVEGCSIAALNGSAVLWNCEKDFVVVAGIIESEVAQSTPLTIKRQVPKIDYVTEHENRLWACRFGVDNDGNFVNEIYATKLGDPTNWGCYMGLSTDSWTASVGSEGPFTGAIPFGGSVLFFKENRVHRLRGNMPSAFNLTATSMDGIARGSSKSAVVINGLLYYQSRCGIVTYDGTYPKCISERLGKEAYHSAVACGTSYSYSVYMKDEMGLGALYVYSISDGIWYPEDLPEPDCLVSNGGTVVACYDGALWLVNGWDRDILPEMWDGVEREAEKVSWYFETGELGDFQNFHVTKLQIRMRGERDCPVRIEIMTEHHSSWESVAVITPKVQNSYVVPLITGRCDHVRIRMSGVGDFCLFSIGRYTEEIE